MYELKKKMEKLFTSKFVGTGPSVYKKKKKSLPGRGLTKVEKHCSRWLCQEHAAINFNKTVKFTCDVTLRRVRVTIAAVEKQ